MTAATVPDVYAAAVLEAAGDQRAAVVADAAAIAAALRKAPEAVALLDHPALNRDQAKELVASVFDGKVSELSVNLLRLLVDRGRLGDLPEIVAAIAEHDAVQAGHAHAIVSSADPLSDADQQSIQAALQAKATGEVTIEWHVEPSLIGGLQIRLGELLVDGSASRRLHEAARLIHEAPARGSWSD